MYVLTKFALASYKIKYINKSLKELEKVLD